MVQWLGDRQPTSAVKCAELVWQVTSCFIYIRLYNIVTVIQALKLIYLLYLISWGIARIRPSGSFWAAMLWRV